MKIFDIDNGFIMCDEVMEALKQLEDNSIDSLITDPPYGLGKEPDIVEVMKDWIDKGYHKIKSKGGFMGKEWDSFVPQPIVWKEVYRVMKPGAYGLVACGTRTQDWMVAGLRFAGFEIRDVITWHFGSGFPKSMNISKAIDKSLGAERGKKRFDVDEVANFKNRSDSRPFIEEAKEKGYHEVDDDNPVTDEAKQWNGWGTALKPATELWTLIRKPISEKTVAQNVLKWGTGGINIDGCRIELNSELDDPRLGGKGTWSSDKMAKNVYEGGYAGDVVGSSPLGRFPANVVFDEFTGSLLDEQTGILKSGASKSSYIAKESENRAMSGKNYERKMKEIVANSGGPSRFFYCAKASGSERNKGLSGKEFKKDIGHNRFDKCKNCGGIILQNPDRPSACKCENPERENNVVKGNHHPTVKPVSLMRWLVKLITPPNGIVLDCYVGSGTTGVACAKEGFNCILIDKEEEYCEISKARIDAVK